MSGPLGVVDLGSMNYGDALALQTRLVEARREDRTPDLLLLVEHPPVITFGRSAQGANLLATRAQLDEARVALHESNRGGDVTYHGPGQLVGYPVIRLTGSGRDIHRYIRSLESVLIAALDDFGVTGHRVLGMTGVWVAGRNGNPEEKIAAIGVAIRHWITMHGFALNMDPAMEHFDLIRPCGIAGRGVTSLAKLLGYAPVQTSVRDSVVRAFGMEFGRTPEWMPREDLLTRIETQTVV